MRRHYFDPNSSIPDLSRRSVRGGAISILAQVCTVVVQIVSTIILARALLPEDFGLVAMVTAITGFASVFVDLGTRDAIAQKGGVTEGEVSALHWITVAVGIALCLVTALGSAIFVRFFGESRLHAVAITLSSTLLIPALYCQQHALMRRAMMFREIALIEVSANALGAACAIGMAYLGLSYWALVWRPVLTLLFIAVGVWITCGWWPGRPTFTKNVKELLKFGLNVTGFTIADYVAKAMDRVALGYTAGARELGYYQNAFNVYDNAIAVTVPLHNVATTALSRLRESQEDLRRAWSSAISALAYFAAPAFAILAVLGQDLVVFLFGDKWHMAGAILAVLALRGPAHVMERTLGWLHIASGRPDRWRRWGGLNCGLTVLALFCGLPFGAIGVAAAYAVMMTVLFVPTLVYAGRPLGITAADVVRATGPQVGTALGVAAIGFAVRYMLLQDASLMVRMLTLAVVCGVVYLAVMTVIFGITRPLALLLSLVRSAKPGPG